MYPLFGVSIDWYIHCLVYPLFGVSIDSICSVKGPELINMYVGQSEANVREGINVALLMLILLLVLSLLTYYLFLLSFL